MATTARGSSSRTDQLSIFSKVIPLMCVSDGHMTCPTPFFLAGKAVLELQLFKGHDLVPKDSNGLSDPYILVKYGSKIVFRSKVIKKCLNPEWNQRVTLTAPSTDDIIYVVSRHGASISCGGMCIMCV